VTGTPPCECFRVGCPIALLLRLPPEAGTQLALVQEAACIRGLATMPIAWLAHGPQRPAAELFSKPAQPSRGNRGCLSGIALALLCVAGLSRVAYFVVICTGLYRVGGSKKPPRYGTLPFCILYRILYRAVRVDIIALSSLAIPHFAPFLYRISCTAFLYRVSLTGK
jgi:hypothetical protein